MKLDLIIKAENIKECNFTESSVCPITKAFGDLGFPQIRNVGHGLRNTITEEEFANQEIYKLENLVIRGENAYEDFNTEPENIEMTLEIPVAFLMGTPKDTNVSLETKSN